MPVAACLAALLVLFGIGSTVLPFTQQPTARAYAKTPNLLTAELDDGIIPFAFDERLMYQSGGAPWSDGIFTTMQFTMGAENVSRIQATLSRGELCLVTTETLERCDAEQDPEQAAKLDEALNWQLSNRGTGAHYADYDYVACAPRSYDCDTLDEYDGAFDVRLIKRLGSTIDVPYEGEPLTFCFWYSNDDIPFYQDSNVPQLVALNGDILTITTQFDDDAFRTQTIELHDGWFAWNDDYALVETLESVQAAGPFKTLHDCEKAIADSDPPYQFKADTLYGVVTSVTDDPHPFPLDNANTRMTEPVEPHIVTLEDMLGPEQPDIAISATPSEDQIASQGDIVKASGAHTPLDMGEALQKLQWSNVSAVLSSVLPEGFNAHEARESIRFGDDLDYLNRCRMATHGWSVSEKGAINEGRSFLTVSMTIANETDEAVNFNAHFLGTICAIDRGSSITMLPAYLDAYVAKDAVGRLLDDDITFQPHESIDVRVVFIISDELLRSGELLFTPNPLDFEPSIAYPHRNRVFDFTPYQFISLGELERR